MGNADVTDKTEKHNALVRRFVMEVIGPVLKEGTTYSEMLVVFESMQVGMLDILQKGYNLPPDVATGLLEASFQRAIVRFAEKANQG